MEASSTKCKVKHLIDNEGYKKGIQQRHTYITERNRNKCSAIFATRTKMLCVKNNYRTAHDDLVCRWCKADQETQDHILKECPNFQCHTEKLDISKIMNPKGKLQKLMQSSSMTSIRKSMIDNKQTTARNVKSS